MYNLLNKKRENTANEQRITSAGSMSLKQKYKQQPFLEGKVHVLSCVLPAVFWEEQVEEGEPPLEQTFSWPFLYLLHSTATCMNLV